MPGVVDQQGVLVAYSKYLTPLVGIPTLTSVSVNYCYQREIYILPRCFPTYSLHRDHAGC